MDLNVKVGQMLRVMTMPKWTDSRACKTRLACRPCRASGDFRNTLADRYDLPLDWPACPLGVTSKTLVEKAVPQTADPATVAEADPATLTEIKRRFAICRACPHSRDNAFACDLHHGCCFGRHRTNPANHCGEGRW